jgi:hypothetical protein
VAAVYSRVGLRPSGCRRDKGAAEDAWELSSYGELGAEPVIADPAAAGGAAYVGRCGTACIRATHGDIAAAATIRLASPGHITVGDASDSDRPRLAFARLAFLLAVVLELALALFAFLADAAVFLTLAILRGIGVFGAGQADRGNGSGEKTAKRSPPTRPDSQSLCHRVETNTVHFASLRHWAVVNAKRIGQQWIGLNCGAVQLADAVLPAIPLVA